MFNNGTPHIRAGEHQEKSGPARGAAPRRWRIGAILRALGGRRRPACPGPDRPHGAPPGPRDHHGPHPAAHDHPGRTRHRVITAVQAAAFAVGCALGLIGSLVALRHGNGLQLFAASAFLFGAATVLQFFRPRPTD
ncbi:hypothetical protein [Kitasatospora sp. NPDC001527]|uniref:hypothetical protein n=1 Tax=Kitasatospora sp. NPDC001527 TaxID=3154519 RepID=UPI00332BD432